jgi:hypothetical protein
MDELSQSEEEWARGWVEGISKILAYTPPEEDMVETKKKAEKIIETAIQSPRVVDYAKTWRRRLLEAISR